MKKTDAATPSVTDSPSANFTFANPHISNLPLYIPKTSNQTTDQTKEKKNLSAGETAPNTLGLENVNFVKIKYQNIGAQLIDSTG